ncbi:MAG: 1-acyl-sn-glycerol-3-phosphate acyltransferase, partial [Planctomycetota bacterium]
MFLLKIIALVVVLLLIALVILAFVSSRRFMRTVMRPILTILYRKEVIGLENLPRDEGCVLISNHVSWIDGILILWMLPRNVRFLVDGGNFGNPVLKWISDAFDTILMMPSPKSIGRALKEARSAINQGEVVGIFPEGTLSRTGQLQAFKPGVTKILKKTSAS